MGNISKYSHWCSTPIDRTGLRDVVDALDKAVSQSDPKQQITITVNGAEKTIIEFPPEQFAEFVAIMKFTFSED